MKWTNIKPDRPGWWWYRSEPGHRSHVFYIGEEVRPNEGLHYYWAGSIKMLSKVNGQFSDRPIPEPEDK